MKFEDETIFKILFTLAYIALFLLFLDFTAYTIEKYDFNTLYRKLDFLLMIIAFTFILLLALFAGITFYYNEWGRFKGDG